MADEAPNTQMKGFDYYFKQIMWIIAIAMSTFHVFTAVSSIPSMEQRCIHVGFALILTFMQSIINGKNKLCRAISFIFIVGVLVSTAYVFDQWHGMIMRIAFPDKLDIYMGCVITIALLEAARRKLGWALPFLAILFILYALYGRYLPASIGHRGYSLKRIMSVLYMELSGIYGQVAGISATYIFLFVLFGAFLENSGAGKFFIDLSTATVGKSSGGSAKVTTVSSCLFGMVSGSAVANVMTVGPLTIPMMEQSGYSKRFSGAITSVAGTGGQFMPPIMGAAAFIIAETLGIPYMNVAKAAFIPGVLYYLAIIFIIDLRSSKLHMKGLDEVPNWKTVLKKDFYLSIPVLLLVYFLAVIHWSPIRSGFWAIIAMIAVSWLRKDTRMGPKKILKAFEAGAYGSLDVAIVCALAGIMIGMLSVTGLGLKFSNLLLALSGGKLPILLALTMVAALILGMGMTTTSVYIILSVLVAPALIKMNVTPLAAHLFVFYFGILSAITPPIATASYAAASVAKDDPMKLGWAAWKIGLSGYILPFMFISSPELLMEGSWSAIILATVSGTVGIFALSVAIEGYYRGEMNVILRVLLLAAAFCLLYSGLLTDFVGYGLCIAILVPRYIKSKRSYIQE
ncbi:MAG: TRAP transporter permease [Pyramidobacter porci]|uniref:TRAP transporter permease n=1 Tax=Pyramidobacter porci TaxID=2605789 RepID=UPI002A752FB1|nr:TRAP transporter permease [Pyramidobacter porci]MDY2649289.1 TRAP transporter permease [Pyramidobacter porci]